MLRLERIAKHLVTLNGKPADRHNFPLTSGVEDGALFMWWLSAWRYANRLRSYGHTGVARQRLTRLQRYTICRSF